MTPPQAGRIGVLVNPASGRGRGARVGPVVLQLLREAGHDVVDLTAVELATARAGAAAFVSDPQAAALVAVGGDGVVNVALNAILGHSPHLPLGIVPAGTGNDAARTLGLPLTDPARAVAILLEHLAKPRAVDVGEVHHPDDPERRRWFLGVISAGVDAAVNARANHLAWPRGSARYVRALLIELIGFRGYDVRATVDGVALSDVTTIVSVANSPFIGGGMRIAPEASLADGVLDVVSAGRVTRRVLLRVFPRVYRGTHPEHPAVSVRRGRRVLLEAGGAPGLAPAPVAHADGEPVGALPLLIRVRPGALGVLA